jgi:F-type H+-transporting ATPase subunit gamma
MAVNSRDIKSRIKSVNSTMKITKAMELVATAKLRKARSQLDRTRPYSLAVIESIQEILANSGKINHPYLDVREVKKRLFIVLTADRGLCGGYNTNVNKLVESQVSDLSSVKLLIVGSKARNYFTRRNYDIVDSFIGISEEPIFSDAKHIGEVALDLFKRGEVDEVNVVYTHFKSTIAYEPRVLKLLPAESLKEDPQKDKRQALIEYEPSPEVVLGYLVPKYVFGAVYGALIEASASEQGARRVAMESATDNAEDIIKDLDLLKNRARQAAITQEITEIVSGANALK